MNGLAYAWLITAEAFEEVFYRILIDPLRELLSATRLKNLRAWAASRQDSRTPLEDMQGTLSI